MGIEGKSAIEREEVLKLLRRQESKYKRTVRELRVVRWVMSDGKVTEPHIQAVEKMKGLGDYEYVKGTKALSPDDWTSLMAANLNGEITDLMRPNLVKEKKEKQEFHDHD